MTEATYLYCVASASQAPSVAGAPLGLAQSGPLEVLPVDRNLWIVSTTVPLDIYGPGPLEERLRNIDWVGETALAHERVVEHFAALPGVTIIPMKLFTLFSTPARAVADIAARRASITAAAKRIHGAEEWGIRILRSSTDTPVRGTAVAKAVSGAAFLAAKKQKRDDVRNARLAAAEAAVAAFEALAAFSRDAVRREDAPPAGAVPPLLDAAFLVAFENRQAFADAARAHADACAKAGAQLMLSGPWPAYSFIQTADGR